MKKDWSARTWWLRQKYAFNNSMNSSDLVQSPLNTGGSCPIAFTSEGLGAAAAAGCLLLPPSPPPPSLPPLPPLLPLHPLHPPLLHPFGFDGGRFEALSGGGILPMLEGGGALVWVILVVWRVCKNVVMLGEMVGDIFNI